MTPARNTTFLDEVEDDSGGNRPILEEAWPMLSPSGAALELRHPCQPVLSQKVKSSPWGKENKALTRTK